MGKGMNLLIAVALFNVCFALAAANEDIAVMVLVNGGKAVDISKGLYCDNNDNKDLRKELLKAFKKKDNERQLRTGRNLAEPFWCTYACWNFAPGHCWLVHPQCTESRRRRQMTELDRDVLDDQYLEQTFSAIGQTTVQLAENKEGQETQEAPEYKFQILHKFNPLELLASMENEEKLSKELETKQQELQEQLIAADSAHSDAEVERALRVADTLETGMAVLQQELDCRKKTRLVRDAMDDEASESNQKISGRCKGFILTGGLQFACVAVPKE